MAGFYKSFKDFQNYYCEKFGRQNPLPWQDGMQAIIWWITDGLPANTRATLTVSNDPSGVTISGKGTDDDPYIWAFNINNAEVPTGPQGPQGPQGEQGPKGEPGQDGTIVTANLPDPTEILENIKINETNYELLGKPVLNRMQYDNIKNNIIAGVPIVEDMAGYSFSTEESNEFLYNFAGIVRNGDKLTLALSVTFTPQTEVPQNLGKTIGRFNIPNSVANKIIPYSQGSIQNVICENTFLYAPTDASLTGYKGTVFYIKGNNNIVISIYPTETAMTVGKSYNLRVELTLLLSNNLIL